MLSIINTFLQVTSIKVINLYEQLDIKISTNQVFIELKCIDHEFQIEPN